MLHFKASFFSTPIKAAALFSSSPRHGGYTRRTGSRSGGDELNLRWYVCRPDNLLFGGSRAEVWIKPGHEATQGAVLFLFNTADL
jgi:hypothetical protein